VYFFYVRGGKEGGGGALCVCEEVEDLGLRAWGKKRGVSAALFRCFQMHGEGVLVRLVHLDQT